MRTTNTFGVQFITRTNKAKDGLLPIYARPTVDGRRVEISLKRWIKPGDWNRTKGSREEIKSLNHYLDEVRARIMECYQEMQVQKRLITADPIKSMLLGTDQKDFTLFKLVEYHNQDMRDTLAWGTMKNYFTSRKYIHRLLKEGFGTTDMFLSELSYKFITDFEFYLRNYKPKDHQKPFGNNGVMKHLERFRKMVPMAVKMEWVSRDPFDKYQLKFHRVDRDFLNDEELEAVKNKDFKIVRLQWVRDLFVFSCYTGLAYMDAMNLTPYNITIALMGNTGYQPVARGQTSQ